MVVFTDLDGTLLDRDTYSHAPADSAIARCKALGVPIVLVTSKTRAEVEALRLSMRHTGPYIIENGAAAILPGHPDLILGASSSASRAALRRASFVSGVLVRGFSDMSIDEICQRSGLHPEIAALAARREYGEPFVVLSGPVSRLESALAELGFQVTRGGRFFHVLGGCDKARAVRKVAEFLNDGDTIGLGDAPNDIPFLLTVRRPILIPSPHLHAMRAALPNAFIAPEPGPAGWSRALLEILDNP